LNNEHGVRVAGGPGAEIRHGDLGKQAGHQILRGTALGDRLETSAKQHGVPARREGPSAGDRAAGVGRAALGPSSAEARSRSAGFSPKCPIHRDFRRRRFGPGARFDDDCSRLEGLDRASAAGVLDHPHRRLIASVEISLTSRTAGPRSERRLGQAPRKKTAWRPARHEHVVELEPASSQVVIEGIVSSCRVAHEHEGRRRRTSVRTGGSGSRLGGDLTDRALRPLLLGKQRQGHRQGRPGFGRMGLQVGLLTVGSSLKSQ